MTNYVIIGGGAAGVAAADAIVQHDQKCSITLITAEEHPPYYRAALAFYFQEKISRD